ncbi:MAG TPA: hydrolase [Clostridiaceae bacterium]|nr:hydrolase [Clostridiaceae bacterium]
MIFLSYEKKMKEKFIQLLRKTNREGIEDLINFIEEKTDFFTAPASTRFHGSHEGGLLEHSMKVYEILDYKIKNNVIDLHIPEDTIIIVSLLHDICKVNFYKVDYRNAKNARGEWEKVPYYTIDDTIPYGHGEKSVMMLTEYIKLTSEEKYSIRWHMGFSEPKEVYSSLGAAYKKYPLALLVNEADLEATYFYDM